LGSLDLFRRLFSDVVRFAQVVSQLVKLALGRLTGFGAGISEAARAGSGLDVFLCALAKRQRVGMFD